MNNPKYKKIYIKTYGCQMNERDSDAIAALLKNERFTIVDCEEEADILIFNTCSVREQAEIKAIGKLGILKRLKRKKPHILIVVTGCMAQNLGEEIIKTVPHVDIVAGTKQLHNLPKLIKKRISEKTASSDCVYCEEDNENDVLTSLSEHTYKNEKITAFVAIMRGCSRFCSYCIVPYVRGREHSRKPADVIEEIERLVAHGIKEIFLLGQNIAAYGLDNTHPSRVSDNISPFADLLEKINDIDGVQRIRFTSPHPAYFNTKLIDSVASLPKVCNSIHLPVQSGSDKILKLMKRDYTVDRYYTITERLKALVPDISFSTDVIVGFPGETQADFNATRTLMNKVGFDNAFIFKYSPRTGTPASEEHDSVPQKVKEERNQILLKDLSERTLKSNKQYIGKIVKVLVEGQSKRNKSRLTGRTTNNKVVVFNPVEHVKVGDIISVNIKKVTPVTLFGDVCGRG